MLHLLGNYNCIPFIVLHVQDLSSSSRDNKFRSFRIRLKKSQQLSNIFGDAHDINEAGTLTTKRLYVNDIYLLEPPPDYEVS